MDARNITFMFYGFALAWLILALFALLLVSRERSLRRQMDNLKQMIEEKK